MPKVYFASDHAGFELKNKLILFAQGLGYEVHDFGSKEYNKDDDYPDFIIPCAEQVAKEAGSFGVVLGKSGQGEAMAANRVKGVRAMVFYGGSTDVVALSRAHNDANILSLGAGFLNEDEAKRAVESFLTTVFTKEERDVRRLAKF